jgi:hypothetical protein
MTIKAVLDRSALRSYAAGHVHVGELMNEIVDEEGHLAVPTAALAEAYAESIGDASAEALLDLLVALPGITVLNLDGSNAMPVGEIASFADGNLPRSHAVWAAQKYTAYYLTTEPDTVTDLLAPLQIHPLPTDDA